MQHSVRFARTILSPRISITASPILLAYRHNNLALNRSFHISSINRSEETLSRDVFSLQGRNFIVTGGGQGIGFAITRAICSMGGNVAVLDLRDQPVEEYKSLSDDFGVKTEYLQTDVTKEDSLKTSFESAISRLGSLHGLVPAAGIVLDKPFIEQAWGEVDKIQQVNVKSLPSPSENSADKLRSWALSSQVNWRRNRCSSRVHLVAS